ncbi:carbon-nitrogen hydrolase family protein [Rhizobium sp. G21]|uniref:carbon-nitrogen hydrolase family protein n=1 Tax=Rhizobium sp. G21 TaxID=2758439 RepID=UPI0016005F7D|nr:carbon-nitrogen hydrolase family protein [Rhizobium sp. G21]MBB1247547.1 carbon-nitrogen hydrolase family protein [Rhizobium sp. G21]
MKSTHFRVALAQVTTGADADVVCAAAAAQQAELIVFPEMFSNGYSRFEPDSQASRKAWLDGAEPLDGAYIAGFRDVARRRRLSIVATFLEQGETAPFNAAVLIDADGEIVLHQRKRHICFFDVPETACAPGDRSSVARLKTRAGEITVGVMICMDREYPEVGADLIRQGADIILVPNSSPLIDDPTVGDVRVAGVRAMAFQYAAGIAVANYPAPKDDGHSFAVDGLGRIIAMGGAETGLVIADFDIEALKAVQRQEWFRRTR